MNINYLFVALSFVFGLIAVGSLRRFDLHEKEPFLKMAIVTVWGGFWSIVIALLFYGALHELNIGGTSDVIRAFFLVGPVEEAAKFIALCTAYPFIRKEMNEPTDGLLYMSCVALGFSLIENYFYATHTPGSGHLLFIRLVVATPAHIVFSIFMGISFYYLVRLKRGVGFFLVSFLYASFIHGLYDAILFQGWGFILVLVLLKYSYEWALTLLSYTTAISPFRKTLTGFLNNYQDPAVEDGMTCPSCGNEGPKTTYRMEKTRIQKCDRCLNYLTTKKGLFQMFKLFGSSFSGTSKYYRGAKAFNKRFSRLYKGNRVDDARKMAFFEIDEMAEALESFNKLVISNFEHRWWYPQALAARRYDSESTEPPTSPGQNLSETSFFRRNRALLFSLFVSVSVALTALLIMGTS